MNFWTQLKEELLLFSHMSDFLQGHGLQDTRLPSPSHGMLTGKERVEKTDSTTDICTQPCVIRLLMRNCYIARESQCGTL